MATQSNNDSTISNAAALVRVIGIIVFVHLVLVAARMTGSLYALSNRASTFTVGVMVALFALVPMLIAVRAGRWLDVVGPWRPILSGTLMVTGGVLLPALFSYERADIAPLLVAAVLIGTGSTLVLLSVQQVVADRAQSGHRATAFSWLAMGNSLSGFCGPIMSGLLIDAIGYRGTFGVMVLILLGALGLIWANRALLPSHHGRAHAAESQNPFDLFKHKELRYVLIAVSLVAMSWDLQAFVVPVHGTGVGLSASQIGFVLGAFSSATFAVRIAMPWLSRRFSEWRILTFTLFTAMVSFALFPLFTTWLPMLAVAFLLGLGLGAAQPNVMSLLHAQAPPGRFGEALGLRTTIINSSQVAMPLVFGAFGSVLGVAATFWMMALMTGSGGVGALRRLQKNAAGAA